jgi:oxalate decarboxylase
MTEPTDWLAHTPPEILAENFGVPVGAFSKIPLHNLWIFQGKLPAALATDQKAVEEPGGLPSSPFTFSLDSTAPVRQHLVGPRKQHQARFLTSQGEWL